jgi:hypothetical protein
MILLIMRRYIYYKKMNNRWNDFIDYEEVRVVKYYDDLNKFIVTYEGKICEAMSIICASMCKVNYGELTTEEKLNTFNEFTNKYMQKSKYDLAYTNLKMFEACKTNPIWNLWIYAGCHNVNVNIIYPFLVNLYPTHNIKIIISPTHTCVADLTSKKIYDLAMWNEILNINVIVDLIQKNNDNKCEHYDFYDKTNLMKNNFIIYWLWGGNLEFYNLAMQFCNTKYKTLSRL